MNSNNFFFKLEFKEKKLKRRSSWYANLNGVFQCSPLSTTRGEWNVDFCWSVEEENLLRVDLGLEIKWLAVAFDFLFSGWMWRQGPVMIFLLKAKISVVLFPINIINDERPMNIQLPWSRPVTLAVIWATGHAISSKKLRPWTQETGLIDGHET